MPRVACLMMQKDEDDLLWPWVKYHSHLFGIESLFIYDNGSVSSRVRQDLEKACRIGVKVDWSHDKSSDFHLKGDIFSKRIEELDTVSPFDFYLPLDCDEFLALSTDDGAFTCNRNEILQAFSVLADDRAFSINSAFYNNLADPTRFWRWDHRKTFFSEGTIGYLDHGFHDGRSKKREGVVKTNLTHIHLHHKPYQSLVDHARNKLSAYVDVDDRTALETYRGIGLHVAKFLLTTEAEYNSRFSHTKGVACPAFVNCLQQLGVDFPFPSLPRKV